MKDFLLFFGAGVLVTVLIYVLDWAKNRFNHLSETADTPTEKDVYHKTAVGLDILEKITKSSINIADQYDASNTEKRDQVSRKVQAKAEELGIPVSVNYVHGMIASEVTNLRYKQGLINRDNYKKPSYDNRTSVTIKNQGLDSKGDE